MYVAMKREAPKALKNKGSAQLTGEKRDEPYREAQRAAAKKLASSETETVLLENREGLTLVGHLRECEKAKRLVIAFHGWRSAWYRDFGLLADFLSREQCSVLYVEQRAQNESEGDYIGFGLTERYDCVDWANWAAERFPGLPVYLMGVSLGGATVLMAAGDILPAAVHGVIADSAYTSPRDIWQYVMGHNLHLPTLLATPIADGICKKRLAAGAGSCSTLVSLAETDVPVLLTGETGTGKEVFSHAIHYASPRSQYPIMAINCSAFSKDLLESELFGYKAGAFTGAMKDKPGLFEVANHGTVFLDEIGEMAFDLQARLLRVLETGEYIKVGDTKPTKVDVRIISATNRDLKKEIENGHFREDLYFRLSVFQIHLPPLRERKEDIEMLAETFLERTGRNH